MLFYCCAVLFAAAYSIVVLPVFPIISVRKRHAIAVYGMRVLLYLCKVIDGITYEVRGKENLPTAPYVVASEHQSPLETMVLLVELENVVFVLKKELKFLPFIGLYMIGMKMIFIDRSKGGSSLRTMLKECKAVAKVGRPVIIFPQGRRVGNGEDVDYRQGVAMLYQHVSVPVLPVAVNTGLYWPLDMVTSRKKRGKAIIEILAPIEPGLERQEFMSRLTSCISERSRYLRENSYSLE